MTRPPTAEPSTAEPPTARPPTARFLPPLLAGVTIGTQILYPLASASARQTVTVLSVVFFFGASITHAFLTRGGAWTVAFGMVTLGGGLAVEAVGVRTGWPFGDYTYGSALRPVAADVPVVVPLAWAMMAYPALLLGQRAARAAGAVRVAGAGLTAAVGGATLVTWDLFLDPQMVAEGYWTWAAAEPALNGIPLTNALGWTMIGTLMVGALATLPETAGPHLATTRPDDRVPLLLLAWTYLSSILANLAFFDRPWVALTGGLGMALPLGAVAALERRREPREPAAAQPATPAARPDRRTALDPSAGSRR